MSIQPTRLFILAITAFIFFLPIKGYGQELEVVTFENIVELQKKEKRPIVVFLTADWCTYCKRVENTSFDEKEVINLLNSEFYFISFNIEYKETIKFGETNFKYNSAGLNSGVHELAEAIGTIDGILNTPTFVVLNSSFEINYRYGGFMDTKEILALLRSNI